MEVDITNIDMYKIKYVGDKWFAFIETDFEDGLNKKVIYSDDFFHWFETDINGEHYKATGKIVYTENIYCLIAKRRLIDDRPEDYANNNNPTRFYNILSSNDGIHWIESELNNIYFVNGLTAADGVICCAYDVLNENGSQPENSKLAISYNGIDWIQLRGYNNVLDDIYYFECCRHNLYIRNSRQYGDMFIIPLTNTHMDGNCEEDTENNDDIFGDGLCRNNDREPEHLIDYREINRNTPEEEEEEENHTENSNEGNDTQQLEHSADYGDSNEYNPEEDDYYDGWEEEEDI